MSAKKVTNKDAVFEDLCKKFNLKTEPQVIPGACVYIPWSSKEPCAIKSIDDAEGLDSFLADLKSKILSELGKKINPKLAVKVSDMYLSGTAHLQLTYSRLETEAERKFRLKREYAAALDKVKREAQAKEKAIAKENKQRELYLKLKNKFEPS